MNEWAILYIISKNLQISADDHTTCKNEIVSYPHQSEALCSRVPLYAQICDLNAPDRGLFEAI